MNLKIWFQNHNRAMWLIYLCHYVNSLVSASIEMTKAFTAGVKIFIELFQARWPWSIAILESWVSMSSSSEVLPCGGCSRLQAEWCVACGPVAPVVLLTLLEVEGLDTEPHPFGCVWIRVGLFVVCGPSLMGDGGGRNPGGQCERLRPGCIEVRYQQAVSW